MTLSPKESQNIVNGLFDNLARSVKRRDPKNIDATLEHIELQLLVIRSIVDQTKAPKKKRGGRKRKQSPTCENDEKLSATSTP